MMKRSISNNVYCDYAIENWSYHYLLQQIKLIRKLKNNV